MKLWAEKFYSGKLWRDCRESYMITKHGICERCSEIAKVVHHKIYLTPSNINDPFITLAHDNLEALCQDCHNQEHHGRPKADLRYIWNEAGEIVYAPLKIPW